MEEVKERVITRGELSLLLLSFSYYLFFADKEVYPIIIAAFGLLIDYLIIKSILSLVPKRWYWLNLVLNAGFMVLLLASFYVHYTMGTFITIDLLQFFINQPFQILEHAISISPRHLGYGLVLVLLLLAINHLMMVKGLVLREKTTRRLILFTLLIAVVPAPFSSTYTNRYLVNGEKMYFLTSTNYFMTELRRNAAPLLSLSASALYRLQSERYPFQEENFTYTGITQAKDFLKEPDSSKINKLNVLLILVESLRSDQLTLYGSDRIVMPSLEKLASKSNVFLNAYTQASHSDFADLCPLSSLYPLRSKTAPYYDRDASYPRVSIINTLKKIGYRTAVVSSQNEHWSGMINYYQNENLDHLFHAQTYKDEIGSNPDDIGFHRYMQLLSRAGKVDDAVTVSHAIDWIKDNSSKPFFMYLNLQSSHFPFRLPADHMKKYKIPQREFDMHFGKFPQEKLNEVKKYYQESLFYVDLQLQKLFHFLEESESLDNTIIVITADTGQGFYEHGLAQHGNSVFDELIKVPLVLYVPMKKPQVWESPVEHIDVPPTIHDLLKIDPHPGFQGSSVFKRPEGKPVFSVCATGLSQSFAVRHGDFKYIYDESNQRKLLFNLRQDPHERTNLAYDEAELTEAYHSLLSEWIGAHLSYYADISVHIKYFPPKLSTQRLQLIPQQPTPQ